jgi:hypothetical protein
MEKRKKQYEMYSFYEGYSNGKGHDSSEPWLEEYVVNKLSNNITTIIDFGCAHGRNFLAFPKEKYKYIGFDMHDYNNISWVKNIDVDYYQCNIEDFFEDYKDFNIDWKNSLIISQGTLMCLDNSKQQNDFINLLKSLGCKNFVFHEYGSDTLIRNGNLSEPARNNKLGYLDLNDENKKMFESPLGDIFRFRDFENDLCAFISLNE